MNILHLKSFYLFSFILCISINSIGQNTCSNAAPFCTSTGVTFPAGVNNGSAPSGPNYSCLGSQPNPAWYYLNISQSGPIDITLTNSANVDIDFILWGPFPNQSVMCSSIMSGTITSSGSPYIVDCSYSTAATEYVNIPNANVGEWYMLLITNFSNAPTNITATQTGGSGATNCAILCNIIGMTASASACNTSNNTYSVTGVITVTAPPSTGNLTITNSCGGTPITMTPPFSTSIPYSFTGLNSNGAGCVVTAGFSADPTCTFAVNYTAPASCSIACSMTTSATQTQSVSCNGGNNGSASVTISGGTSPYSYTWSPTGGNSSTASGLTAGVYTVTVKDVNNCTATSTVQITQSSAYTLAMTTQSASCSTPGSATINVSGGAGSYSYTWSPTGGNSNVATGLSLGSYTVSIKDANNCYTTSVANITGAPTVSITSVNVNSVLCNGGSSGSATVNVSGGAVPYNYTWTPSVSSSSIATGLGAGTYSVLVMDNNNCTVSTVITITQPPALSLTATQVQSVSCNSGNNGVATSTASGGVGGYTYTWTPSGGNSSTANNLTQGIYTIMVSDANNCGPISATVQIQEPPALSLTATQVQSVSCNGGNNGVATSTASGGVGGYTYTWSPTGGNSPTATGLSQGVYTINVKDGNNCGPVSTTVQILEPPALSITATGTNASCYGYSDGSASVSVSGGMSGYSYTWSPSGGYSSFAGGLVAGTYTVNVKDVNGCPISTVITITQPSSVNISTNNYTICYGNSVNISANASGGTPPYTYSWMPTGWTGSGPYSQTLTATSFYTVFALDANNCSSPVKIVKVFVMPPLLATGMSTTVCDGETANIYPTIVSNGNGGSYIYNWSNGAGSPTISVTGIYSTQPNVYTVTISDGCSVPNATTTCTVFVNPIPKGSFVGDIIKGCAPLLVNFNAVSSGGNTDTYSWNFGNGMTSIGNPASTNYTMAGVYSPTLTITSQYGCVFDTVATNYIHVYPYPVADFNADPWGTSIVTPTINFVNTSVGAVSYLWNFGDYASPTNTSTAVNPSHEYTYSGSYTVSLIATNQYGCADYIAKSIYIEPEFHIYIPNVFTPDGNGLNDVFLPKGIGIDESDYKMLIFDRWGELIFQSNDFRKGWDGSVKGNVGKATQDVYVYNLTSAV